MEIEAVIEDSTRLKLLEPLNLPAGSRVSIDVHLSKTAEHEDFTSESTALLERAYGIEEPDYSLSGEPLELHFSCSKKPDETKVGQDFGQ